MRGEEEDWRMRVFVKRVSLWGFVLGGAERLGVDDGEDVGEGSWGFGIVGVDLVGWAGL